jgi:hypothetical protein
MASLILPSSKILAFRRKILDMKDENRLALAA